MSSLPCKPYVPPGLAEWDATFRMLCMHCAKSAGCTVIEGMIEMKDGHPWPLGGWVTDPGAGSSCLSYEPQPRASLAAERLAVFMALPEAELPPVCGGCAARKGSEASVSLHTRRDYAAAVRDRHLFVCHEDPALQRPCGGWVRAIRQRGASA